MGHRYYQADVEQADRAQLRAIQEARLQRIVDWTYRQSPFYRQMFAEHGLEPAGIRTVDDLAKLPAWQKERYREDELSHPPYGSNLCRPIEQIVMVALGSGTTGPATLNPFTDEELDHGSDVVARALVATGCQPGWNFYDTTPQGLHFGWSYVMRRAAQKAGMSHTAADFLEHPVQGVERRLDFLHRMRPQFMFGAGPTVVQIGHLLRERGIENPFSVVWYAGEAGPATIPTTRRFVERLFPGARVYDVVGPMDFAMFYGYECVEQHGMHVPEDHLILEVLAFDGDRPAVAGERGRIVVTHLTRDLFPFIRFDLEDVTSVLSTDPCPCGRTLMRISGTAGRTSDLTLVQGKQFLPSDVERIARELPDLTGEYQIIRTGRVMDALRIRVEYRQRPDDESALRERIATRYHQEYGVPVAVELVEPGTLVGKGYKSPRVAKT